MSIVIKLARTTGELDDVLDVRFDILSESERSINNLFAVTKKVTDHYDVYPSTLNFIVYRDGKTIGTIRAIEYDAEQSALNENFDFRESYKKLNAKTYILDMFALKKDYSLHSILIEQMLRTTVNVLAQNEGRFAFFGIPSSIEETAKNIGFKAVAQTFHSQNLGIEITPAIVDVTQCYDELVNRISDKEIMRFQEVFYNIIFEPGEIMVVQGEKGSTAYLIESGEVEVLINVEDKIIPVSTIGAGNLIGEIAMVTSEVRTASIMAKSTTSCIAFNRDDFMDIMYQHPHRMLDIFKIFSKRISASNKKLAEMSQKK